MSNDSRWRLALARPSVSRYFHSYLDETYRERGRTEALVALTGGEGLLPDSARQYRVQLEWWLEDGEWMLARLNWQ